MPDQTIRRVGILFLVIGLAGLSACWQRPISTFTPTPTSSFELTEPIITSGNVKLPLTAPTRLELHGASFDVKAVQVQKGQWHYQRGQPNTAQWVYGTLINYVIGLEATAQNAELFQALTESDVIRLTIANNKVFNFQFSGRQWVEQDAAPDVFQQVRPGITLVLLGDKGTKRLVVTGSYVSSIEPTPVGMAKAGEWVRVGDTRVMALEGRPVKDVAGLPEGYMYYRVDFSVENVGAGALDASMFQMDLIDGLGNRYIMSIPASQGGRYGPAGGQLEPGQVLTATAGYIVPTTISGPLLEWTFSPRPAVHAPAHVQLPLATPVPTPEPRSAAIIQINTVTYGQNLTEIVVAGGIGNPTDRIITVNSGDVWLESGAMRISLIGAEPPLPWSISPGESRAFTLHFARPAPGAAVLHILHWAFELSGLY